MFSPFFPGYRGRRPPGDPGYVGPKHIGKTSAQEPPRQAKLPVFSNPGPQQLLTCLSEKMDEICGKCRSFGYESKLGYHKKTATLDHT